MSKANTEHNPILEESDLQCGSALYRFPINEINKGFGVQTDVIGLERLMDRPYYIVNRPSI